MYRARHWVGRPSAYIAIGHSDPHKTAASHCPSWPCCTSIEQPERRSTVRYAHAFANRALMPLGGVIAISAPLVVVGCPVLGVTAALGADEHHDLGVRDTHVDRSGFRCGTRVLAPSDPTGSGDAVAITIEGDEDLPIVERLTTQRDGSAAPVFRWPVAVRQDTGVHHHNGT